MGSYPAKHRKVVNTHLSLAPPPPHRISSDLESSFSSWCRQGVPLTNGHFSTKVNCFYKRVPSTLFLELLSLLFLKKKSAYFGVDYSAMPQIWFSF